MVDATPLDTSKAGLDRALNSLVWMKMFLIIARWLDQMTFKGPSSPNILRSGLHQLFCPHHKGAVALSASAATTSEQNAACLLRISATNRAYQRIRPVLCKCCIGNAIFSHCNKPECCNHLENNCLGLIIMEKQFFQSLPVEFLCHYENKCFIWKKEIYSRSPQK